MGGASIARRLRLVLVGVTVTLLAVMALGVTRIGATQTKPILDEYRNRR
jgi:hypothetical protein